MVNDKYVVKYLDPRTGKYEYATIKDVGDLQKLNTKVKTSIVDAINSISTDGIDGIDGLRNDLDTIGKTIKSLEDGTLELGDFQSIDDVVSREIEDAINSLKDENSGLLKLTQEEIDKIVSDAESEYRDSIAASVKELETSKSDLEDARKKMTSIGQMLENADINYSSLTQVVDDINLYITDVIEKTDFDMVNGIVSDYKTAVTQSKDGWGVDASKNMLSYLTGRVKSNETSLDVQHGLIQAKVGKDEFQYMTVDNLPAGKENMLHNTSDLRDWNFSSAFIFKSADDYRFTSIVQSDSAGENITGTTDELEQGVTYAISAYVNVQNKNKEPGQEKYAPTDGLYTATVIIDEDTIELNNVVEDNSALDGWKRVSGTFIAKRTAQQDIKFYVTAFNRDTQVGYLSAPKLEKGSSATSWIPHIEDNVSTILSQNAVMRVLSDRITSSVEEVRETKGAFETATSTFDQMADGFELNTNKLSEVLDKYGEVTGIQTQQASELEVLNESITSKVWKQDINTTLDTINIDTSNRIVNSAFNIYSYDEQTGALKLDYWDNNTGFAIKKHSQSLDNYLYAKRSNATSVNPISIKSSPFALRDGEKILFNFEYLAVGNPLDNDNVITLEMYDNNDVRVGLQEFKLSELKKEFLTAYDVGDSYKYNGSYIVKNSSVVKGTITLKLPKNGELWLTKVMLQNAGIGTIGWTPSSIDNQIIQSKLSTEINQLADSIELVAKDERLDAISGLLVKKDGKITISPEAIVSRVTSQELGEKGLITQTSLKQTEDNLRFDLVDKDGIIQTINASADGLLIDFDKVQIDGELIARMISAQSIDATQGFRLTDNNGNTLLAVVNDNGKPTLSIARDFNVKFRDFSNKLDVTVVNVVDEYYHSTDETKPAGGQWTSAPNDFRGDTFVWKRTKVVLQSGKEYYLPDENGINITSGWNYAKGEVTNAIESAIEEAEQAVQSAKDADVRANEAIEKAGANANLLTTHQNTLNTIKNTTIPNVNKIASDAMAEAQSALSSASSAMSEAKTALSSAGSAMDEAKKTDGKIADYVTKNGLVNGTTVDSKIDEATGEISKKITTVESKIDGLQVGGRNLIIRNTETPNRWVGLTGDIAVAINHDTSDYINVEPNTEYMLTKSNSELAKDAGFFRWSWYDVDMAYIGRESDSSNEILWKTPNDAHYVRVSYPTDSSPKLEKGNKATDWTPAPEDNYTQEEFKIFESTYDEDVKGIRSSLSSLSNDKLDGSTYTTFYKNEYEKTAEGLRDAYEKIGKVVDENGNTKDTFAKAVYDRNAERQTKDFQLVTNDLVTTATYSEGVKGINQSITTVQGKLDNMQVGGRNLLRGTADFDTSFWQNVPTSRDSTLDSRYKQVRVDGDYTVAPITSMATQGWNFEVGEDYVVSVYAKSEKLGNKIGLTAQSSAIYFEPQVVAVSEWRRFVWKFKATSSTLQSFRFETRNDERVWITQPQIEKGSVPTDWSPAPEDMLGKADFQIFKGTYENNDQAIKNRLTAIDSGKDGSILYKTNEALSTAQGNTQTITTLDTKVDNLKVGGENLLSTTADGYAEGYLVALGNDGSPPVFSTDSTKANTISGYIDIGNKGVEEEFVFSKKTVGNDAVNEYFRIVWISEYGNVLRRDAVSKNVFVTKSPSHAVRVRFSFPTGSQAMMQKGNKPTEYVPSLQDQLGKETFTLFQNEYDETAKSVERRLTAIDSTKEGSVVTRLNKTESTASGNSQTIATINKNYVKQSNIDASILADKKIKDTRSTNQLPSWYFTNYPSQEVREFKQVSTMGIGSGTYGILTTNVPWTEKSGGTVKQTFETNTETHVRQSNTGATAWGAWSKQIDTSDTTYQKITQTSSLYERVLGSTENNLNTNISKIVQTSEVIQQTVTSAMNVENRNLLITKNATKDTWLTGSEVYPTPGLHENSGTSTSPDLIEVKSGDKFTLSKNETTLHFRVSFLNSSKKYIGRYVQNAKLGTITPPSGTAYIWVSYPTNAEAKIEKGTIATGYSPAPEDTATQSHITQLADNINLKVSNKDLLSQINVQAGGVLITSGTNKLNITPSTTYIQNATIKAAMIDTISASQIKTGKLDADLITSGIADKTGNRVIITNTGMKVSDSTFETEFINGGPGFFTKNSSGRTFIGEIGDMTSVVGGSKALGIKGAYGIPIILGVQMSKTDTAYKGKLAVHAGGVITYDTLNVEGDLLFTQNGKQALRNIINVDKIFFHEKSYITASALEGTNGSTIKDTAAWINLQAQWGVNFWYQNQKKARQYGNKFQFWCNIEPQSGFSVSGSSDVRLKHNIADVKESSLEKLEKIQFKNFTWNSNNKDDFGFIAQEVINIIPEIIEESDDGYYRYNSTRFNMIVAHATKELNDKVKFLENKIERLERIIDGN